MTNRNMLITDGLDECGQSILRSGANVDDKTGISSDDLHKVIPDYDGLIVRGQTRVTASVMEAGTSLKVVGRADVGVNNIDLDAAERRNVTIINSQLSAFSR